MKNKYDQLNIITVIAMAMIYTLHFIGKYFDTITLARNLQIAALIRSASLIAVPIFVANISYTYIKENKKVSFSKIFIFIIIPTILLSQLTSEIYDFESFKWNFKEGFSRSWFGDMFVGLMLCIPLLQYIYVKSIESKKKYYLFMCVCFIAYISAYILSVIKYDSLLSSLGVFVFVPYLSMLMVINYVVFENKYYNKKILIILLIICVFVESKSFLPNFIFQNRAIVRSYFSPITLLEMMCLYKLVYNSNIKINGIRKISETSYFFYFTHYLVLHFYFEKINKMVASNLFIFYPIGLLLSFILSYIIYHIYLKLIQLLRLA